MMNLLHLASKLASLPLQAPSRITWGLFNRLVTQEIIDMSTCILLIISLWRRGWMVLNVLEKAKKVIFTVLML